MIRFSINRDPNDENLYQKNVWVSLSESSQYLVINTTSYMAFTEEYQERIDLWRNICGDVGCDFGSGKTYDITP